MREGLCEKNAHPAYVNHVWKPDVLHRIFWKTFCELAAAAVLPIPGLPPAALPRPFLWWRPFRGARAPCVRSLRVKVASQRIWAHRLEAHSLHAVR